MVAIAYFKQDVKNIHEIVYFKQEKSGAMSQDDEAISITSTTIPMPSELVKHSSSVISIGKEGSNDVFALAYFSGDREGASNVKIYANYYDKSWSKSYVLLDRARLMRDSKEFINRLGNPLLIRDGQRIYLFVVATSIGGWGTSKIYQYEVLDFKKTVLEFRGALHLSAFLNISNLIRNGAVGIDGGFALPYYHESFRKFALLGIFRDGKFQRSIMMNGQNGLLQPSLVLSHHSCVATFRSATGDSSSYLQNCGRDSLELGSVTKSNLTNFDSAQIILEWGGGEYMIYTLPGRLNGIYASRLKLLLAKRGKDGLFKEVLTLAETKDNLGEVSYPSYLIDSKGRLNVFFTQDKKRISQVILEVIRK